MKSIHEMSLEELRHITIGELRNMEGWQRWSFENRLRKLEEEEGELKNGK